MQTNTKPEGLSEAGSKAYEIITKVLRENKAEDFGGCKVFYSPTEWKARGEEYGTESELVVVYDGGDHGPFFSLDRSYPTYRKHTIMMEALNASGLYADECTGWYAAVYADK